jgi:uncharacterized coiled-coil DUF342 family protein
MEKDFNDLKAKSAGDSDAGDDQATKFSALEKENGELKAKVAELETKNTEFSTKFTELNAQFTEYKSKLDDALKEDPAKSTQQNQDFSKNIDANQIYM